MPIFKVWKLPTMNIVCLQGRPKLLAARALVLRLINRKFLKSTRPPNNITLIIYRPRVRIKYNSFVAQLAHRYNAIRRSWASDLVLFFYFFPLLTVLEGQVANDFFI
jgi:hypothetical protein